MTAFCAPSRDDLVRFERPVTIVALPIVLGDLCDEVTPRGGYCAAAPFVTAETEHGGIRVLCHYHTVKYFPSR